MTRTRLVWGIWIWLALVLFLAVHAVFAAFLDRFPGDEHLTNELRAVDVPALGGFLNFANAFGDTWLYISLTIALAFVFMFARAWTEAVLVLLTFVPRALNGVLKGWVERPRPSPELVEVQQDVAGFAFPSGHTAGTAALFGLLFFLIPVVVPWRALRWALQLGCVLIVISAGPARIYLGVHWPSDVLGGYVVALLFLVPALAIYRTLRAGRSTE